MDRQTDGRTDGAGYIGPAEGYGESGAGPKRVHAFFISNVFFGPGSDVA